MFMMLVALSVLNGFVDKIERAAKGLFGDVVVSTASLGGLVRQASGSFLIGGLAVNPAAVSFQELPCGALRE